MYNFYKENWGQPRTRHNLRKILLIMKLTTFILITGFLHLSASSLAQKVTLVEKNAPLVDVFNQIRSQTGYDFLFTGSDLKNAKPVTINVKNEELTDVLNKIFEGQPLDFSIENKSVVVQEKKEASFIDKAKAAFAQTTITGKVQDETGQPLPGVTVKQKGTSNAVATDTKGQYSLTVPDDKTIITFTYIGYEPQELPAKDISNGSTIIMKATQTNLREVVVNKGYYTERQELSTGNVSKVTAKEIAEQPVSDPIQALEGRVAGLYIQQTSGIPGASSVVTLRGKSSIANGNDPLYVVDGVPFTSTSITAQNISGGAVGTASFNAPGQNVGQGLSPFNTLNPQDIESIEILKDADATAIYGSRGANGVILITTKKGRAGATLVDANVYSGIGQVARQMDLLNTQQYLAMRHQAFKNDGQLPGQTDYDINGTWDTTRYTNWQKVLTGNSSHFTNAQLSVSGGTANTQFLFGGGYSKQTTVFPGSYGDQKATFHFSLNNTSSNGKFKTQLSGNYANDNSALPRTDLTGMALYLAPDAPALYDGNGTLNWQGGTWANPLSYTLETFNATSNNLIGNLRSSYEIIPGLQVILSLGYNRLTMNQNDLTPATTSYGPPSPFNRVHSIADNYINSWIIEPQATYTKSIGKGHLDLTIGATNERQEQASQDILTFNYGSDQQISDLSAAGNVFITGNFYNEYHYSAIYGRLGYNWDEKYLLNITARRDGSSRFGPGNQFGNFGSVGAGWIFTKEKFFSDNLSFLSFGKLRASYGTSGNDQIQNYQYLSAYGFNNTGNPYQGVSTISPNNIGNPYFGWELDKKLEVAIELGFLSDRIQFNAIYSRNRTGNQLVGEPLPTTTGFTVIQANLPAIVQNKNLEFELNTTNVKAKNFGWTTSINFTIPTNKLVAFPGLATNPNYQYSYAIGKSIYTVPLTHYTGIDPQTGTYTVQDVNHDGQIDVQDFQFLKQIGQTFYGGFSNNINYKGWQLSFLIQFVKQTARNYFYTFHPPGFFDYNGFGNEPTAILNAWTSPGDKSITQKYSQNGASPAASAYGNFLGSDATISNASFIRLKNISLSYQLPQKWQQGLHLRNARVYVQAQNLLTFTNYLGLDPESQGTSLPPLRMITTGIQLGL